MFKKYVNPLLSHKMICGVLLSVMPSVVFSEEKDIADRLSESVPQLLDIIDQRNKLYKEKLNDGGMTFNTYQNKAPDSAKNTKSNQPHLSKSSNQHLGNFDNAFENGMRDPFAMTSFIANKAMMDNQAADPNAPFFQKATGQSMPSLKLRGIMLTDKKVSPMALLEIVGDDVYLVKEGDEISFNPSNTNQVLKIQQIDRLSLIVEVGTLGDIVVVR